MMKKRGFTLAEVLITLTIIGVVATMTLPALMTNTAETQAKTGLKKGINTLTEAAQMHEATEGYNYASLTDESNVANLNSTSITEKNKDGKDETRTVNTARSLAGMLRERTKVDVAKTIDAAAEGANTISVGSMSGYNPIPAGQVIYFNDGTALIFNNSTSQVSPENFSINEFDGLPNGYVVVFDINGIKGPNELSNCKGYINGGSDMSADGSGNSQTITSADVSACANRNARVIKDQFLIRLRGNMVQPEGAAATWAFGS